MALPLTQDPAAVFCSWTPKMMTPTAAGTREKVRNPYRLHSAEERRHHRTGQDHAGDAERQAKLGLALPGPFCTPRHESVRACAGKQLAQDGALVDKSVSSVTRGRLVCGRLTMTAPTNCKPTCCALSRYLRPSKAGISTVSRTCGRSVVNLRNSSDEDAVEEDN